jgi:GNAT superfamily N-acetyltransferase
VDYESGRVPDTDELVRLYGSVGWSVYTDDPEQLAAAVCNSTFVVTAYDDGLLVGLLRAVSDDVSIVYVQDLLVDPDHQQRGIGRRLLERCLDRFAHVRQRVLLTDDEPHQHRLYRSVGLSDVAQLRDTPLHAFVDIAGATLVERESEAD